MTGSPAQLFESFTAMRTTRVPRTTPPERKANSLEYKYTMVHAYNNCEQRSRGSSASTVSGLAAMRATVACTGRAWGRPSRGPRMRSRVVRSEPRAWASLPLTNKAPHSTLTRASTMAKRQQKAGRQYTRGHGTLCTLCRRSAHTQAIH